MVNKFTSLLSLFFVFSLFGSIAGCKSNQTKIKYYVALGGGADHIEDKTKIIKALSNQDMLGNRPKVTLDTLNGASGEIARGSLKISMNAKQDLQHHLKSIGTAAEDPRGLIHSLNRYGNMLNQTEGETQSTAIIFSTSLNNHENPDSFIDGGVVPEIAKISGNIAKAHKLCIFGVKPSLQPYFASYFTSVRKIVTIANFSEETLKRCLE